MPKTARAIIVVLVGSLAVVVTILLAGRWISGPAAVGAAILAATITSSLTDDRLAERRLAWRRTVAQGAVGGAVAWLTFRCLTS